MAEGSGEDFLFNEENFVEKVPESFSCPICFCTVQRDAHLTGCCGHHFCFLCIDRIRSERKPCPMCKESPVVIFPNKQRQREIKELKVRCSVGRGNAVARCSWEGTLAKLTQHMQENHGVRMAGLLEREEQPGSDRASNEGQRREQNRPGETRRVIIPCVHRGRLPSPATYTIVRGGMGIPSQFVVAPPSQSPSPQLVIASSHSSTTPAVIFTPRTVVVHPEPSPIAIINPASHTPQPLSTADTTGAAVSLSQLTLSPSHDTGTTYSSIAMESEPQQGTMSSTSTCSSTSAGSGYEATPSPTHPVAETHPTHHYPHPHHHPHHRCPRPHPHHPFRPPHSFQPRPHHHFRPHPPHLHHPHHHPPHPHHPHPHHPHPHRHPHPHHHHHPHPHPHPHHPHWSCHHHPPHH